jgi:molybdopterin biosynthesis enzyme MoaB
MPTAILSRPTDGIRGHTWIVNIPGRPPTIYRAKRGLCHAVGRIASGPMM